MKKPMEKTLTDDQLRLLWWLSKFEREFCREYLKGSSLRKSYVTACNRLERPVPSNATKLAKQLQGSYNVRTFLQSVLK